MGDKEVKYWWDVRWHKVWVEGPQTAIIWNSISHNSCASDDPIGNLLVLATVDPQSIFATSAVVATSPHAKTEDTTSMPCDY